MNLFFARICIAVCGLSVPFMFDGQMWALAVFMLGLIGILYHARTSKLTLDKQSERPNQK
jgi:hypothetical protein